MEASLVSSKVVVVRADTPVSECVGVMREHDRGAVIVMSDDGRDEIAGIFTERDLLRKFNLIHGGNFWDKPVRTVMTQPVKTIPPSQINRAAEIMIAGKFRHLPVTLPDAEGKEKLLGIISMRDLFRVLYEQAQKDHVVVDAARREREKKEGKPKTKELLVVSRDNVVYDLLKDAMADKREVKVRKVLSEKFWAMQPQDMGLDQIQGLFIDVDNQNPLVWTQVLKELNHSPHEPLTIVVFDPALHGHRESRLLTKLAMSPRFTVFTRPLDLAALFGKLGLRLYGLPGF